MSQKRNPLFSYDLECVTWYGLQDNLNATKRDIHTFLTSLEGLLPYYSVKFLTRILNQIYYHAQLSNIDEYRRCTLNDTIKDIESELAKRKYATLPKYPDNLRYNIEMEQ